MVSLNDALMDLVAKKLVAPEDAGIDTKFTAAAKEN